MQAIETKFHGPTNTRGARIIATCAAKRKEYGYDHALNIEENHRAAALKLYYALGWKREGETLVTGSLRSGVYCHVIQDWSTPR